MSTSLFDILKHGMPGAQETVAVPTQASRVFFSSSNLLLTLA